MVFSPYADLQTCSYQGRTVRLHYSLLQLSVYAETENEHFAVCLQQGKVLAVFSITYLIEWEYIDNKTLLFYYFIASYSVTYPTHSSQPLPVFHFSSACPCWQ